MTLQERMIATYLRQANLPPEEKMKLKLFLGLLLVTFDSDPSDEDGQDRTRQDKTGQDRTRQDRTGQDAARASAGDPGHGL